MSDRNNSVEWIETTEEVVITEECLPTDTNTNAVIPVLEPAEAPIQKLLGAVVHGENSDADDVFCCEECLTLFQDQTDPANISGPSFVLDFPTAIGVPQRALLTLPYGLTIGRSSIPTEGVGVINHGPTVSPGMHFGPYEGEMAIRENAMASDYSWEIFKGQEEYEYVDATRDTHSNWMRYVNCARNKDETNLLAVQYKGSILFHCCRIIHPGEELMVWPSSKLFAQFSEAWSQIWFMKLNTRESNTTASTQIFLCPHCQLSFTTETYLQRHTEYFHAQPTGGTLTKQVEANEPENPSLNAGSSVVVFSVDPIDSKTCSDCGKTFKQMPHLRRHKLCVHSNKRPYCCPHCRRSFSQASGLIRHQLVHKKQNLITDTDIVPNQDKILSEKESSSLKSDSGDPSIMKDLTEATEVSSSQNLKGTLDANETENTPAHEVETSQGLEEQSHSCSDCGKGFATKTYLKKHKMTVHSKLRPYVCTLCQKCFGQYNDLSRHLQRHKNQSKNKVGKAQDADDSTASPFSCAECSLNYPSVDALQEHLSECHSVEIPVENQEEDSTDDGQSRGPDSSLQPPEPETAEPSPKPSGDRPQRLGARSKISAITKLIAPKRRTVVGKKSQTSADLAEKDCTEPEVPHVRTRRSAKHKWYSCSRCKRTYTNAGDLKTHSCALKQHKCGRCGATFNKSGFLRRHEQTVHGNTKSYSCERCGRVFSTSGNLKQHQKSKTCERYHCASELFSCSFCQFSFTMKNYLIKHVRRHHPLEYVSHCESDSLAYQPEEEEEKEGGKEYLCSHCGKSYASAKALKSHTCFQQVKILYLCTDCGKGFSNHYGLKQHQRIHTGEKPFSCPHCSKSFSYTGQLNVHLRTHTGEKPYLCTHCGESFRQSGDLKRHERKHTGVRPYSCPECCKSFSRPQSLKAHQMLHLGQKMFKCTQCGKSFSRNYHLRRHHQKMHL